MGAKNSVAKHDLESLNTAPPARPHLYEEIDEVLLVKHQAINRQISSSTGACNLETDLAVADEGLAVHLKSKSKSLPDVIEAAKVAAYSPKVNKRYHLYDEIKDEQLSCNQNSVTENKAKQTDKLKDKTGKKKKNKKKENENVHPEVSNAVLNPDASPGGSEPIARFHPYDEITELHGSHNAKKVGKEDNSKVKNNFKDKKKQKELSAVDESISLDTASKLKIATRDVKAAPRGHTYEEITDEQLSLNQGNTKSDKHDKTNMKKVPKEKAGMKSPMTMSESSLIDNQVVSNTRFLSNTGSENPQTNTRYHPYDEIAQEALDSNRKMKEDKGNKLKKQKTEKNEDKIQAARDFPETEYLNVGAAQATCGHSRVGERFSEEQCEEKDDSLKDLYAVPQKKQLKDKETKELNYIEVEFNSAAPKVADKGPYSPTAYTNVISKDGKFVVLES